MTCLFNELCALNLIAYDVADFYFRKEAPRSRSDIEKNTSQFHRRLTEWADRLPQCLKIGKDTEIPHILCLQ